MKRGLHVAWCEDCNRKTLIGGPVAVARHFGVDRRTVYSWRVMGWLHAEPHPHERWALCACSACGRSSSGPRCERCRKIFGEEWEKRERRVPCRPAVVAQ